MKRPLYKLVCPGGTLGVDSVHLNCPPRVGDTITIFNFPSVEQFVVERLDRRQDWFAQDWLQPMAIVVRLDMVLQTAAPKDNVVPFNQDVQLDTRLAKIEKIARKTVSNSLQLEISHRDFVVLCAANGISAEMEGIDVFAYHDVPMEIGDPSEEWGAATSFSGFSGEMHTLYVTWPCGAPFVMNARLFDLAKDFYACLLSTESAVARALSIAFERGAPASSDLEEHARKIFAAMGDGLLPIYDGAQALTQLTLPSYAEALKRIKTEWPLPEAPEGTRRVAGAGKLEIAGVVDALSGLPPTRH